MKDKTDRVIAIIALIFMAAFVVTLTLSLAGVSRICTYVAIGSGAVAIVLFLVLKLNGRGFSLTEMNNEIEMEKIKRENEEAIAKEKSEQSGADENDK